MSTDISGTLGGGTMLQRLLDALIRSRLLDIPLRLVAGFAVGLFVAACLSIFVLLMSLLRGSTWYPNYELTTWEIIGSYFVALPLVGTVVALLAPLARWQLGAAFLSVLGLTLLYTTVASTMGQFDLKLLRLTFLICTLVGPPFGLYLYYTEREKPRLAPLPNLLAQLTIWLIIAITMGVAGYLLFAV